MAGRIYIARISPNYVRCEVWHGEPDTHILLGRSIITPNKGLKRRERYDVITEWLTKRFDLQMADYEPTMKRQRAAS